MTGGYNEAWASYLRACKENRGKDVYAAIERIEWRRLRRRVNELRYRDKFDELENSFLLADDENDKEPF